MTRSTHSGGRFLGLRAFMVIVMSLACAFMVLSLSPDVMDRRRIVLFNPWDDDVDVYLIADGDGRRPPAFAIQESAWMPGFRRMAARVECLARQATAVTCVLSDRGVDWVVVGDGSGGYHVQAVDDFVWLQRVERASQDQVAAITDARSVEVYHVTNAVVAATWAVSFVWCLVVLVAGWRLRRAGAIRWL